MHAFDIDKVYSLLEAYKTGKLGGEKCQKMKEYIAKHKKKFPYLGGNKICNYWLYVMEQYTDVKFVDRENIRVAPDTHVIQASERQDIISSEEAK